MADMQDTVKTKAQELGAQMGNAVASATEKVKNAARSVMDQTSDFRSEASSRLQNAGAYVSDKADDAAIAVGGQLKAASNAVRQNAPSEGTFANAAGSVAQSLQQAGESLEHDGVSAIGCQISKMIKNNPIPAVLMAIGLGMLISHATSRRD